MFESALRVLAQSSRRLLRRPALTLAAVLILGLAIGANTAIFSLLDTVALRPLPFRQADELVRLGVVIPDQKGLAEVSWPKLTALAEQSRAASAVAGYYEATVGLTERERPREIDGLRVSEGFFRVWGVEPLVGRVFNAAEQRHGGAAVVLLSYGFWRQRFSRDRGVLGRTLDLDGVPTTVIGVLPETFRFPFNAVDVWLPRPDAPSFLSHQAVEIGAGYLQIVARLRPGVSLAAAQADFDRVVAAYKADAHGHLDVNYPLAAASLNSELVGQSRTALTLLLAAVGLVLLIACADVAGLLLADGLARQREIAVRVALGASNRNILAQALRDSLLIAASGGVLGVALAHWGLRLLVAAHPAELPRLESAAVSGRALFFAILVTTVAGVLAGLIPAWQAVRADPRGFLGEGSRSAAGGRRAHLGQGVLVSLEIALALVLVSAAGLLLRSLQHVGELRLGFAPDHLVFVQVTLPPARYPTVAARRVFFDALVERVGHLPGVHAASTVEYAPTTSGAMGTFSIVGQPPFPPERRPLVLRLMAGAGYLQTIGARLLAGHDFDPRIAPDAAPTAIITRAFRDRYFPGVNPLGQRLRIRATPKPLEIVGVVDDIQQQPLEQGLTPMMLIFHRQATDEMSPGDFMNLAIRTPLPLGSIADSLRREVHALDPSQPLPDLQTVDSMLRIATAPRRLMTGLFAAFSALALLLAMLGIYGVVAQSVVQREREIGVRLALGAARHQVLGGLLRATGRWIVPGLVAGEVGSFLAGQALASQLFEVDAANWLHFTGTAVVLGCVALAACLVPASRATRLDPVITLRE